MPYVLQEHVYWGNPAGLVTIQSFLEALLMSEDLWPPLPPVLTPPDFFFVGLPKGMAVL